MEIAWVSPLRASDRLVLLALAWRAPKGATAATAPVSDLARLAGLSPDQTRRVLHLLVAEGVIRCTHPGGGRQAATYELIHTPLHSHATPCTATPEHPLHSCARAPLAQLCKPLKEKKKNSPSARVREGELALDINGITHQPRDAEALRQIAQHPAHDIGTAVARAAAADPMGRAWPSKVLRLLTTQSSAQTGITPAWAACADWLN